MTRIFGIAGIFAFSIFSFLVFDRSVQPPADNVDDSEQEEVVEEAGAGLNPVFLAFAAEFDPGEYRVGESAVESVRKVDRDIEQRPKDIEESGRTPLDGLPVIEPGLYTTEFGAKDCSYALSAVHKDRTERDIGSDSLAEGRLLVTIDDIEPDRFVAGEGCGAWAEWSGLADQLISAPNGDYWKGDLAPGVWQVPTGCIWEKVLAFRGSRLSDVEDSGIGPVSLEIDGATSGVRLRGCKTPISFVSSS